MLLCREGQAVNKKRVQRLYREEGLSLRGRRRKKRRAGLRVVLPGPNAANQRWSMDFMSDALADGRRFRLLNVVDDWTRECLAIEVGRSLTGTRCASALARPLLHFTPRARDCSGNRTNARTMPPATKKMASDAIAAR